MAIKFPRIFKSARKSQLEITPTFMPLEWVNSYISNGLTTNQRQLLELYLTVPELQAVINYKAKVFSGMRVKAVNDAGDERKIPAIDLFSSPNPIQNFREFSTQYYILRAIFGNEFIHPVFGSRKDRAVALWNLPPMNAKVIPAGKNIIPFNATDVSELISEYEFTYNGKTIIYQSDEIIHYNDNQVQFDRDQILLGDSKLRPLTQACENIKNAYEARGILIQNSALGMLTNNTTDGMGTVDLGPDEREALQKDYREKYGLTKAKWQLLITNRNLNWVSMAVNVGQLKLFEEVDSDFRTIANAHSFPPEILQSDSTYENKEKALIQLYNEAVIPEANEWLQGIANWMQLDVHLKADYSHISVLQMNKEQASKAMNWAAVGLAKAIEAGFMTVQEAEEEFKKYLS